MTLKTLEADSGLFTLGSKWHASSFVHSLTPPVTLSGSSAWSVNNALQVKDRQGLTSHLPVTNWLYYDSIYTERYMSTPSANPQGYIQAGVNNVTAFSNVDFLLAHGTGDDNVHFANSASLLDKFTQQHVRGWRFRMFVDS